MPLAECRSCGGNDFRLVETQLWTCAVGDDSVLSCRLPGNEIDEIYCTDCDETYDPRDFTRIDFN